MLADMQTTVTMLSSRSASCVREKSIFFSEKLCQNKKNVEKRKKVTKIKSSQRFFTSMPVITKHVFIGPFQSFDAQATCMRYAKYSSWIWIFLRHFRRHRKVRFVTGTLFVCTTSSSSVRKCDIISRSTQSGLFRPCVATRVHVHDGQKTKPPPN